MLSGVGTHVGCVDNQAVCVCVFIYVCVCVCVCVVNVGLGIVAKDCKTETVCMNVCVFWS